MRLVHHHDDPTPTTNRLVAGNLFHLEPLKRRRHVVLGDVIRREYFDEIIKHVLFQPIRKVVGLVGAVLGVSTGLAALDGDAAVRVFAGNARGETQIEEFIPEGGTVHVVARATGVDRENLLRARPIERKFGLEHLGIRTGLRALAVSHSQAQITHHEVGDLTQTVRKSWVSPFHTRNRQIMNFAKNIIGMLLAIQPQVAICKMVEY